MKVFVFIMVECVDGDDTVMSYVYSSKEKAKEHFDKAVKEAKEYAKEHGWEFEEDEQYFSSYPEGYYSENHSHGQILEHEVR